MRTPVNSPVVTGINEHVKTLLANEGISLKDKARATAFLRQQEAGIVLLYSYELLTKGRK